MSKVKLCKFCKKHGTFRLTKGYTNEWSDDVYICPDCKHQMIDVDYPSKDFDIITQISYDPTFIESMIALRKSNPIEYQLKLSQIKSQTDQNSNLKKRQDKQLEVHCPYCNSININKISGAERAGSIALFGIFSKKINKSFKCNNCGGTF